MKLVISLMIFMTCLTCCLTHAKPSRKCHVSVENAKVQRLKPRLFKILCHPGFSTSTGQDHILIQCRKNIKTKLNLCLAKSLTKIQRPYPLFQADDPNVDNNIILLDNDQGTNDKGVYKLDEYEEYDDSYDPDKDYGDYYDYDYDKEGAADYYPDENYDPGESGDNHTDYEYNQVDDLEPEPELEHSDPGIHDEQEVDEVIEEKPGEDVEPLEENHIDEEDESLEENLDEVVEEPEQIETYPSQEEEETIEHTDDIEEHTETSSEDHEEQMEHEENSQPEITQEPENHSNEEDLHLPLEEVEYEEPDEASEYADEIEKYDDDETYPEEDYEGYPDSDDPEDDYEEPSSSTTTSTTTTSTTTSSTTTTSTTTSTTTTTTTTTITATYETDDYDDEYDYEEYDEDKEDAPESNAETEAELIYRNYEILSDFYKKHFVDLRVLDTTCEPSRVPPPKIEHGYVKEYLTTQNVLLPGQQYHEVVYSCNPGYKLSSSSLGHMFCQQQGWMGVEPYCEYDPNASSTTETNEESNQNAIVEDAFQACEDDQGCEYKCQMINGLPTCVCQEGYVIQDVTTCVDIDECLVDNGGCQYDCLNKPGTYQCECPPGYMADDLKCVDNNECVSNNGHGPCQDTCINTEGSFYCSCEGLPGTRLANDEKTCQEIDLCEENNGGCSHDCHTSYGQSFCMCPTGMKLDIDWKTCLSQEPVDGSSVINCGEGYKYNMDNESCEDVDECDSSMPCGKNGVCVNESPGFLCQCHRGYQFDGTTCTDVNECSDDPTVCINGVCLNNEGSYQCQCHQGYKIIADGSCQDINECLEQIDVCRIGICLNMEGSYECDCPQGFKFQDGTCLDINECLDDPDVCGGHKSGTECVNLDGSFECQCKKDGKVYDPDLKKCKRLKCKTGFTGHQCDEDIDECLEHVCPDENAVCINLPGSFRCQCKEEFQFDQLSEKCTAIGPQCSLKCSHACGPDGVCICPKGYILNSVNNVECIKKPKKNRKKKKIHGCPAFNEISGVHFVYSKDIDPETGLYPRSTTLKGKCMNGYKASPKSKLRLKCKKDGSWKGHESLSCNMITCPYFNDLNEQVTVQPESCALEDSQVKTKCSFSCPEGYKLLGSKNARCKKNGTWKQKGGPPKCIEKKKKKSKKNKKNKNNEIGHPIMPSSPSTTTTTTTTTMPPWPSTIPWEQTWTPPTTTTTTTSTTTTTTTNYNVIPQIQSQFPAPFIYCPPDVIKDLPSLSPSNISAAPSVYVRIPQPKTNVNWYDYVKSYPPWAKNLEAELGLGKTLVTFTASSPASQDIASCSFTIHVRDIVPPRVYNCPNDFDVYLDEGQIEKQVYWDEPIFADNVKIAHVMASKLPGYKMKAGRHAVLYQAADSDGNKARCVFTVTVWDSSRVHRQERSWVLCRVGSTGRQIKLYLSHVPIGCERL